MKKTLLKRGLFGFPVGISVGYVITIILSAFWGQGRYAAVTPQLLEAMGNEINAVIVQAISCGAMGTGFAMASVIWEIDSWSIVKQTSIYFVIISAIMLPIAYLMNWMQHTVVGFLSYAGIFVVIFLISWLFQYLGWRAKVKKINEGIKK